MREEKPQHSIILRPTTMKTIYLLLSALLLASCATHRYGRQLPLTEAERATLSCEELNVEIAKVEAFLSEVNRGAPGGAAVLAFLGDFGIGNAMERDAARRSGEQRLFQLKEQRFAMGCPGALKPEPLQDLHSTAENRKPTH